MQGSGPKREQWEPFLKFLLISRKFSPKKGAVQAEKSRFLVFCRYFLDKDFNLSNFESMLGDFRARGLKDSTLNKYVTMGKNICRFKELDFLRDFTYFKESHKPPLEVLSPEDIKGMAEVKMSYQRDERFINQRDKTLIYLLGLTGCRIDEALSLKFKDIHGSTPQYLCFRQTKNHEDRYVPVTSFLYDLLVNMPRDSENVFISCRGGKLENQQVNEMLKRRAWEAGIKFNVYCHLLRHSYITTMIQQGVDWFELSQLVGHKDPKTTMRYYHSLLSRKFEIVQMHPLLKPQMSWSLMTESLKRQVDKIVDKDSNEVNINEDKGTGKLTISILKKK